ncbi:hypothetical protein [Clostridium sp. C8-1-8]|uniref:hypothetical protein n=1 Tax=Clostridium sp. C8-1-8 TaxID=2698831 RepID=UPI00136FDBBA|nr:hypothetical protein [Clostridium sp. C8-1-8]
MKKNLLKISIFILLSSAVFILSYYLTKSYYLADKKTNGNNVLYNSENGYLKDDMKLVLKSKSKDSEQFIIDGEYTVKELKKDLGIEQGLKKDDLVNHFKALSYSIESMDDSQIILSRSFINKLQPNKYYLGEKNDFFAIYKTDSKGVPYIENASKDIFADKKKVSSLPEQDKKDIVNFKMQFKTRDDAEEAASGYF